MVASEYQLIELDGEVVAITNYRLEIAGRPLMGAVSTNSLTLVLPGGPIGDAWMLVPGTPVLPVGTRLLLSGIEVRPGVVMASGFDRGILREFVTDGGDSVVADAFGTPVLDWRCESVGSPT